MSDDQPSGKKAPRIAWWLATGFGSGYLRPAPGTWGSLAGLGAWLVFVIGARLTEGFLATWVVLVAPMVLTLVAVWAADRVVKETNQKDPSFIVIDEWAGIWFALTPLLLTHPGHSVSTSLWIVRLAGPFALFRLFDIWKPGPIDRAQGLPGGWGVIMDDVLAGILAAALAWPLDRWLSR